MKIAAFDLGTKLGWSILEAQKKSLEVLEHGVLDINPRSKLSPGEQMIRLSEEIEILLNRQSDIDRVVYEEIVFAGKFNGAKAAQKYGAIKFRLLEILARRQIEAVGMNPIHARKVALGVARLSKEEIRSMVARLIKVRDSELRFDDADSIVVGIAFLKEGGAL